MTDVEGIIVDLKSAPNNILLFLMLGADGSITRRGTGAIGNTDGALHIGITDPAIFKKVLSLLTEQMLQCLGRRFQHDNISGAPCNLTLAFQFTDKASNACEYLYGSESAGPPNEVAAFVRTAVYETEKWYQEQLRRTSGGR